MGSLALRPGDSLTILLDGFVNRLQESQFPSSCYSSYGALNFYPGGTSTHCSYQPSLDAHFPGVISHMPVRGQLRVGRPQIHNHWSAFRRSSFLTTNSQFMRRTSHEKGRKLLELKEAARPTFHAWL